MNADVRWGVALALAARLGVAPESFWRLSVAEWRALATPAGQPGPLSRAQLDELMTNHPDR